MLNQLIKFHRPGHGRSSFRGTITSEPASPNPPTGHRDRDRLDLVTRSLPAPLFLGEQYRRIAHRRGKKKAIVAVGRSILMIVWHLLSDDDARFVDLGSDYYESRVNLNRRTRNHVRELQALGYKVILEPAA